MLAAERYDSSEPVNLGTGQEISIRDLAETIARETGFEGEIVWDTERPTASPPGARRVAGRAEFGFRAEVPLDEGIRRTIAYYRQHTATPAR